MTLVAPGLHRFVLPLPFKMEALNAWLIETPEGCVLLDTGMSTRSGWRTLERSLLATGRSWSDIRFIVLTHMHPDHVGLALQARQASGAQIVMHSRDAALLDDFSRPGRPEYWNRRALALAGTPEVRIPPVIAAFNLLTVEFPRIAPDLVLEGGEVVAGMEVIWAPGHSPGHILLYDRSRERLFSGDHLLETASPNIGWLPDEDPLGGYLDSLAGLSRLRIETVYPGHGDPFSGVAAWIARAVAHHRDRLSRIHQIASAHPQTAHAISEQLWTAPLDPIQYRFAIFEVLAHLAFLERRGAVQHDGLLWSGTRNASFEAWLNLSNS